jgi:hypothetical protein
MLPELQSSYGLSCAPSFKRSNVQLSVTHRHGESGLFNPICAFASRGYYRGAAVRSFRAGPGKVAVEPDAGLMCALTGSMAPLNQPAGFAPGFHPAFFMCSSSQVYFST